VKVKVVGIVGCCSGPTRQKCYSVYVPALANDWSSCRKHAFTWLMTVHSVWQWHGHGTVFQLVSLQHVHWLCSKDIWKSSCLITLFR